jgi:hypothetical protein
VRPRPPPPAAADSVVTLALLNVSHSFASVSMTDDDSNNNNNIINNDNNNNDNNNQGIPAQCVCATTATPPSSLAFLTAVVRWVRPKPILQRASLPPTRRIIKLEQYLRRRLALRKVREVIQPVLLFASSSLIIFADSLSPRQQTGRRGSVFSRGKESSVSHVDAADTSSSSSVMSLFGGKTRDQLVAVIKVCASQQRLFPSSVKVTRHTPHPARHSSSRRWKTNSTARTHRRRF